MTAALDLWKRCEGLPFGKAIFSRIICWKAPYFGSIRPRFEAFGPGYARVSMRKRRAMPPKVILALAKPRLKESRT